MEPGEDPAGCAQREIEEETGIRNISILNKICETYHVYEEFGKTILKTTHWFSFSGSDKAPLTPQTEEDIVEVKWISKGNMHGILSNTYPSIRDVISKV